MAHAAFGHNHFFKNNYLFRQWTDANGILDYLSFARDYVQKCEERHGAEAVERVLDAAHALKDHGVNRYAHRTKPNLAEERRRAEEWRAHFEATYNDLWRTVPGAGKDKEDRDDEEARLQEIKRRARPARREPALFHRETRAAARGLATGAGPYRPPDLAVFLPAKADADDERGLRDLLSITRSCGGCTTRG